MVVGVLGVVSLGVLDSGRVLVDVVEGESESVMGGFTELGGVG